MKIQQNSDQLSPEMTIETSTNKNRLMEKETFPTQLYRHIKVDHHSFSQAESPIVEVTEAKNICGSLNKIHFGTSTVPKVCLIHLYTLNTIYHCR